MLIEKLPATAMVVVAVIGWLRGGLVRAEDKVGTLEISVVDKQSGELTAASALYTEPPELL